ncbi:hypothetical protein BGZ72_001715 [Mortierella alpina]|nr:hypothetical protein BGZ72_001715 [Mortierella alpina]
MAIQIIGTLIGTGIFASPGPLFDSVHCTQTSFMIWAFAGIVCTVGAFAYAELGTMFPESGGDFQYLSRAYGKKVALVFGWSFITILNPIGTAGIAGVLGRYSVDMITYFRTGTSVGIGGAGAPGVHTTGFSGPGGIGAGMALIAAGGGASTLNGTGFWVPHAHSPYGPGSPAFFASSFPKDPLPSSHMGAGGGHAEDMPWVIRGFSIGAIVIMGLINIFFKEGGKYASNILAIFKIAGMCMLIVIGSVQAVKNHARSEALSIPIGESSQNVLDYVSALCFAFFAYNGFNNINLGLGELRDPERNLKRAVWIAMPFVTLLFLLANFAFFSILSSYDLRHVHSLSLHAGHTVLGQPGGFLMAGTVVASALGSINANIWAGSRLLAIMAKDNTVIPIRVGKVWSRTGTQAIAILILIGQASIHAIINLDFKTFSKIYSAVGWSWYGLSIAGLLYLRKKRPAYPRPVKVFWPLAGAFILVAFFLVVGSLTLAFMGVSAPSPKGEEEEKNSVDRYMPVIMFSAVILFMTGVIPAFYLTRYIKQRDQQKQSSQNQRSRNSSGGDSMNGGENADDRSKRKDVDDFEKTRNEKGFLPESPFGKHTYRREQDTKPARRFSTASSVTLVGESKRDKNRRRKERQQRNENHRQEEDQHYEQSRPGPSRTNSHSHLKDEMEDEDEEEMVRIQALRDARLVRRRSMEGAETGESNRSSMDDGSYFLTGGSGKRCMSPYSTACPSENGTPLTSACPTRSPSPSPYAMEGGRQQQLLGLPNGLRSGSRSSESTVGMEADYYLQEREAQCYDNEQQQQRYRLERHPSTDSIEELRDQQSTMQVPEILFEHFTPETGVEAALRAEEVSASRLHSSSSSQREKQIHFMTFTPQLVAATIRDDPDLAQSVQDLVAAHPDTAPVMARLLTYIQNQWASSSGQPDAKRQRLDSSAISSSTPTATTPTAAPPQPDLGPEIYSTTPLSFLHPIRKKVVFSFHQSDLALVSATNSSEILCRAPYNLIHRVISVPFLERTKKQTAVIIFFKHSPITPAKDAIWAVPVSDDGKDMTIQFLDQHKHLAGLDHDLRSPSSVQKPPVPFSSQNRPDQILVSLLSYFIHRANPASYSSSVDMIPNPPSPYPHFTAHLKSNSATIYLLPTGILFAFRKPLLFLRSNAIEAVGVHSVMSRTFDFEVVMDPNAAPEDLEGVPLDSKDGRRVVGFGMVDTKEFARMEDWIKKAGIRDRSLSEDLKAKDKAPVSSAGHAGSGANSKKRERTADDDDDDNNDDKAEGGAGHRSREDDDDDEEDDEDFAPESDDEIMEEYDSSAEGSESDGETTPKTRKQRAAEAEEESLGEESLGEDSDEEEEEDEDEDEAEEEGGNRGGHEDEDEEVDELQDD